MVIKTNFPSQDTKKRSVEIFLVTSPAKLNREYISCSLAENTSYYTYKTLFESLLAPKQSKAKLPRR